MVIISFAQTVMTKKAIRFRWTSLSLPKGEGFMVIDAMLNARPSVKQVALWPVSLLSFPEPITYLEERTTISTINCDHDGGFISIVKECCWRNHIKLNQKTTRLQSVPSSTKN